YGWALKLTRAFFTSGGVSAGVGRVSGCKRTVDGAFTLACVSGEESAVFTSFFSIILQLENVNPPITATAPTPRAHFLSFLEVPEVSSARVTMRPVGSKICAVASGDHRSARALTDVTS